MRLKNVSSSTRFKRFGLLNLSRDNLITVLKYLHGNRNFIIRWLFSWANKNVIRSNSWKLNLDKIRLKIRCIFFVSEGNEPLEQCTKDFYGFFEEFFNNAAFFKGFDIFQTFFSRKVHQSFLNEKSACVIKLFFMSSIFCRTHDKALTAQIFGHFKKWVPWIVDILKADKQDE